MASIWQITLSGYDAQAASESGQSATGKIALGTWGSYGHETIQVTLAEPWDVCTLVTATFWPTYPPDHWDTPGIRVALGTDGLLTVPPEATNRPTQTGRVVFEGLADNEKIISADVRYTVRDHAPTGGTESTATPSLLEQLLTQTGSNAQVAAQSADAAAKSASAAAENADAASASKTAAATSEGNASASADAAAKSAEMAADSQQAAKASELPRKKASRRPRLPKARRTPQRITHRAVPRPLPKVQALQLAASPQRQKAPLPVLPAKRRQRPVSPMPRSVRPTPKPTRMPAPKAPRRQQRQPQLPPTAKKARNPARTQPLPVKRRRLTAPAPRPPVKRQRPQVRATPKPVPMLRPRAPARRRAARTLPQAALPPQPTAKPPPRRARPTPRPARTRQRLA